MIPLIIVLLSERQYFLWLVVCIMEVEVLVTGIQS